MSFLSEEAESIRWDLDRWANEGARHCRLMHQADSELRSIMINDCGPEIIWPLNYADAPIFFQDGEENTWRFHRLIYHNDLKGSFPKSPLYSTIYRCNQKYRNDMWHCRTMSFLCHRLDNRMFPRFLSHCPVLLYDLSQRRPRWSFSFLCIASSSGFSRTYARLRFTFTLSNGRPETDLREISISIVNSRTEMDPKWMRIHLRI